MTSQEAREEAHRCPAISTIELFAIPSQPIETDTSDREPSLSLHDRDPKLLKDRARALQVCASSDPSHLTLTIRDRSEEERAVTDARIELFELTYSYSYSYEYMTL